LRHSIELGNRIVFVDEAIFTSRTIFNRGYFKSKHKLKFPKMNKIIPPLHLVAGVSKEYGFEGYVIYERSVDSKKFLDALPKLLRSRANVTLLGDNASWHTSRQTFSGLGQLGIYFIKNVPYSPQLNPIENVFSLIKNNFKRGRL
jgi:hypothetical protein